MDAVWDGRSDESKDKARSWVSQCHISSTSVNPLLIYRDFSDNTAVFKDRAFFLV